MAGEFNPAQFFTQHLIEQLADAIEEGAAASVGYAADLANAVEAGIHEVGPKMLAAHSRIALAAQESVLEAYDEARANGRHSPPYRTNPNQERNRRYAGGLLRDALESPDFSVVTDTEILFANTAMLNTRAKQWARLNFGAEPNPGPSNGRFPVTWGQVAGFTLGLDEPASAAFSMPSGYWLDDEFYPKGEGASRTPGAKRTGRRRTKGIYAEHFLDAGLRTMAEMIPIEYEQVVSEVFSEAFSKEPETIVIHTQHGFRDVRTGRFTTGR